MNMHTRLNVMDVLDHTGHTTVTWDPNNAEDVADARRQFERLRAAGYSIFRMMPVGQRAVVEEADTSDEVETFDAAEGRYAAQQMERIDEFDPEARRTTAMPQRVGG